MSQNRLAVLQYRALLRLAKSFDKQPVFKAFVASDRKLVYNRKKNTWVPAEAYSDTVLSYMRTSTRAFCGAMYYKPERSALEHVVAAFRGPAEGLDVGTRLDVGFATLRYLNRCVYIAKTVSAQPEETAGAAQQSLALQHREGASKGGLLVAHPLLVQPCLTQSVVLLCEHDPTGTLGLVLNQLVAQRLSERFTPRLLNQYPYMKHFKNCKVFKGGDVSNDITLVHANPNLDDVSKPIRDGLFYTHNLKACAKKIEQGRAHPKDFKVFVGYAGWGAGQLEGETEGGLWFPCDGYDASNVALCGVKQWTETPIQETGHKCWARVMKSLGGEFAEFATVQDMAFLNDKRVETCLANLSTYGVDYERASERNT